MGTSAKSSGLYKVIITMFIESSALCAVIYILYIVPLSLRSGVQFIFFPILASAQVRVAFVFS